MIVISVANLALRCELLNVLSSPKDLIYHEDTNSELHGRQTTMLMTGKITCSVTESSRQLQVRFAISADTSAMVF